MPSAGASNPHHDDHDFSMLAQAPHHAPTPAVSSGTGPDAKYVVISSVIVVVVVVVVRVV